MSLGARFTAYSDIGKIREKNEDCVFISSELRLAIVADGMGGHNAGEIASSLAVAVFTDTLLKVKRKKIEIPKDFLPDLTRTERKMLLAADTANRAVYEMAQKKESYRTMGTTFSALMLEGSGAVAVHVGDTRVYLYRQGNFLQVTTDHSLAEEQVQRGLMTKEEAEKSRLQNVLTRAMGIRKEIEFDLLSFKVEAGDVFLLCSDGLNKGLTDEEIKNYMSRACKAPLAKLCRAMIKRSNEKNGRDNISAIIIQTMEGRKSFFEAMIDKLKKKFSKPAPPGEKTTVCQKI